MDAYGVRYAPAMLATSWNFRSVLFARGLDASRAQNQWFETRDFLRVLMSCYLFRYCSPRSSGVRSVVSDLGAIKQCAQVHPGADGWGGDTNHFRQIKPGFLKFHKSCPSQTRRCSRGHALRISQNTVQPLQCGLTKF